MDHKRRVRIIDVEPFDYSKVKPLTNDEFGYDSPGEREFMKEQEALAPEWDRYLSTVDLSHLGTKVGVSSHNSKKLRKLIREAIALKKRLKAHLKNHTTNKDSKKLLISLRNVIHIVSKYYKNTRDLPFDWIKRCFPPDPPRGSKLSYPDADSDDLLMGSEPVVTYNDSSDDDECETVNESETVDGHLKGPNFSRLVILSEHLLDHRYLEIGFDIQPFPINIEQKIWREFREFDSGIHEAEVTNPEFVNKKIRLKIRSIKADHPIVSVVGNFAVSAFNEACNKHVKDDEHENLHDVEFMECKYVKVYRFYHFYLIIEAIEEGIRGTYWAEVICDSFGAASMLFNFVLTDFKPSGTKAMAASYLFCLESIRKTMNDLYEEKLMRLTDLASSLKEPQRSLALCESYRLKRIHPPISSGLFGKLVEHTDFHFPPDCKRRTDPGSWSEPRNNCRSGMVLRVEDNIYRGYNYCNPYCARSSSVFGIHDMKQGADVETNGAI